MLAEGTYGPTSLAAGAGPVALRFGQQRDLIVTPMMGKYYELMRLGLVFSACNLIAGVSPEGALDTTPPFTLYNPKGSGLLVVPLRAKMHYVSGTMPTGLVVLAENKDIAGAAPSGGTALAILNRQTGKAVSGGALAYTGATLAATPVQVAPMWNMNAYAGAIPPYNWDPYDFDGEQGLAAGASVSLQGASGGAGTAPLVVFTMIWAEIPTA